MVIINNDRFFRQLRWFADKICRKGYTQLNDGQNNQTDNDSPVRKCLALLSDRNVKLVAQGMLSCIVIFVFIYIFTFNFTECGFIYGCFSPTFFSTVPLIFINFALIVIELLSG